MDESPTDDLTPRQRLLGLTLPSGWTLERKLPTAAEAAEGTFGTGYVATRGSDIAFVKAVDFVRAMQDEDPISELAKLIGEATFERDVLEYCSARGMSRVLRFIGHEYIFVGDSANVLNRVSCLIMEAGDDDLRQLINKEESKACSWSLFVLSDVCRAMVQLHSAGIAHQDVKPSNVIGVRGERRRSPGATTSVKVGDLGRVVRRDNPGPFDGREWPGDIRYCPPERWYKHVPSDWNDSREASDAYMLGSLLVYLFTGVPMQLLLWRRIPDAFRVGAWGGAYDDDLLPILVDATARVLDEELAPLLADEVSSGLIEIARRLTHPDPRLRGDPRARRQLGRPVGLDRIQQQIDALAMRSAASERGRKAA